MAFEFQTVSVKTEIQQILNTELIAFGYKNSNAIKVLAGDPQTVGELPCIGINRVDDSETSQSLSDSQGSIYDQQTEEFKTFYGTFFAEQVEIRIWHTNADERDKLYQTVKAILFAKRSILLQKGLLNLTLRGGKDEQDSTMEYAPMVLYWATITMSYLNPLDAQFTESVEAITAISSAAPVETEIIEGGAADG